MDNKTVLLLNSSMFIRQDYFKKRNISTQWGSQRVEQYILGLSSLKTNNVFKSFDDTIFTDNTIKNLSKVPYKIKQLLPENTIYSLSKNNKSGKKNKGAGLVENLKNCSDLISKFDYIFYFEPRLIIKDPEILVSFSEEPKKVFFSQDEQPGAYRTGHFGTDVKSLNNFLDTQDINKIIDEKITIEYEFYKFFHKYNPIEHNHSISRRNTGYRYKLKIDDEDAYENY